MPRTLYGKTQTARIYTVESVQELQVQGNGMSLSMRAFINTQIIRTIPSILNRVRRI
jgi:hypothetical protein